MNYKIIKTLYKNQLNQLKVLFRSNTQHSMLLCPDIDLLNLIIDFIAVECKISFDKIQK